MPRLDNSNREVIEVYNLEFNENDQTEPVDLCIRCYYDDEWHLSARLSIEHPDYSAGEYYCLECGEQLTGADNQAAHLAVIVAVFAIS